MPAADLASKLGIITTLPDCPLRKVQAKVLGLLLQREWPEIPRAIICGGDYLNELTHWGWEVIPVDDARLDRGFEAKLELWRYTPFDETLYLDADVLPRSNLGHLHAVISGLLSSSAPVAFYGEYLSGDGSYQGTPVKGLAGRGIQRVWAATPGGHYFWRRGPGSERVFTFAAEIALEKWPEVMRFCPVLTGRWQPSDETLVSIALALAHPDAAFPPENVVCRSHLWRGEDQIKFLHFLADRRPLLYAMTAFQGKAPIRLCVRFLFEWGRKGIRKTIQHYRNGGGTRARAVIAGRMKRD